MKIPKPVTIAASVAAILPDSHIGLVMPGSISACGMVIGGAVPLFEYLAYRKSVLAQGAAE